MTFSDKGEVQKWVSDNGVSVLDVSRLSKDDGDTHLYKIKVLTNTGTLVSDDFWSEFIVCRPFFQKRRPYQNK